MIGRVGVILACCPRPPSPGRGVLVVIYRSDGKSQILVRPSYYDANLPIEEYLLAQLVATLAAEDEVYRSRPIEDIAAALTRRLLRQTIRALGPTERLFALPRQRNGLLGSGVERACRVFDNMIDALEDLNFLLLYRRSRELRLAFLQNYPEAG